MTLRLTSSALLCHLGVVSLLAGCTTVGTDYAGPPATPATPAFARAGDLTGSTQPALAQWWTVFGDPGLNALVDRALQANPNLSVARARLRQARAALSGERANRLPSGSATLLAAHARLPSTEGNGEGADDRLALPSSLNLFSGGFDATWEIDLFGGQRRATEAAGATAEAAQANLADVRLSLSAEVTQAYVNLRATQVQIRLSEAAIARQQRMLDLTARRVQAGTASQLDLVRLEGQLESTRAEAEPLGAQFDAYRDELAVLTGATPGALDEQFGASNDAIAAVPLPPAAVPVGDPTAMLQRRPDIRAAERTFAARSAQVGQAQAARFPRLTLMGLIGIGGTHLRDLTHLDDFSAIAAPQLSWNVLDFGRTAASVEQAEGVRDEAEAQYRATVLAALRDAEDALSRFRQRRTSVATVARVRASADRAAQLMAARQRLGTASLIDLLDTERQQLSAERNLAQAQAALTSDFIALHKALGLGWEPPS